MVNAAALCRGDIEPELCLSCLNDSIIKLQEVCPSQKAAVGYYEDCWLKYSNASVMGDIYRFGAYAFVMNQESVSDKVRFVGALTGLMYGLIAKASGGNSLLKFATGETTGPDSTTIYGLVQCTPELTKMQCGDCLENAYDGYVANDLSGRLGGTIFLPMCRYSYGLSRFFNDTTPAPSISSSPSPVSSPPPPPGTYYISVYLI